MMSGSSRQLTFDGRLDCACGRGPGCNQCQMTFEGRTFDGEDNEKRNQITQPKSNTRMACQNVVKQQDQYNTSNNLFKPITTRAPGLAAQKEYKPVRQQKVQQDQDAKKRANASRNKQQTFQGSGSFAQPQVSQRSYNTSKPLVARSTKEINMKQRPPLGAQMQIGFGKLFSPMNLQYESAKPVAKASQNKRLIPKSVPPRKREENRQQHRPVAREQPCSEQKEMLLTSRSRSQKLSLGNLSSKRKSTQTLASGRSSVLNTGQKLREMQSKLNSNYDKLNAKLTKHENIVFDQMQPIQEENTFYDLELENLENSNLHTIDQIRQITEIEGDQENSQFFSPRGHNYKQFIHIDENSSLDNSKSLKNVREPTRLQRNSSSLSTLSAFTSKRPSHLRGKSNDPTRSTSQMNKSRRSNSSTCRGMFTSTTDMRRQSSYDPMKRSIMKNHMQHKGRVQTFQQQFAEQKHQIKTMITQQITLLKTQLVQAQKQRQQKINECIVVKQQTKDAQTLLKKKQEKTVLVTIQKNNLEREINNEMVHDIYEISNFKQCLNAELKKELHLKNEIQTICMKYKKLLAEQRKEKEKSNQVILQQRKILVNLQKRRDTLADDSNKIYGHFNHVVDKDVQRQQKICKSASVMLNKKDLSVINC